MDTEILQDHAATTTGKRLRQARENIGLSQQAVANTLCLKLSTVRDIEDGHADLNISSTFLRGYIRSYARLVHLSEEEVLPMQSKQAVIKAYKVMPMQKILLDKICKKYDSCLIWLTYFILLIVISFTGIRWWKNYQTQQQDTKNITSQSSINLSQDNETTLIPFSAATDNDEKSTNVAIPAASSAITLSNNYLIDQTYHIIYVIENQSFTS